MYDLQKLILTTNTSYNIKNKKYSNYTIIRFVMKNTISILILFSYNFYRHELKVLVVKFRSRISYVLYNLKWSEELSTKQTLNSSTQLFPIPKLFPMLRDGCIAT